MINRDELRLLADNAESFVRRANENGDDSTYETGYDVGYGMAVTEVLRWLARDDPTGYLGEVVAD